MLPGEALMSITRLQADPAHAFFLETAVESSKGVSASTAVGGRAA